MSAANRIQTLKKSYEALGDYDVTTVLGYTDFDRVGWGFDRGTFLMSDGQLTYHHRGDTVTRSSYNNTLPSFLVSSKGLGEPSQDQIALTGLHFEEDPYENVSCNYKAEGLHKPYTQVSWLTKQEMSSFARRQAVAPYQVYRPFNPPANHSDVSDPTGTEAGDIVSSKSRFMMLQAFATVRSDPEARHALLELLVGARTLGNKLNEQRLDSFRRLESSDMDSSVPKRYNTLRNFSCQQHQ